jgi:hypothetical protein
MRHLVTRLLPISVSSYYSNPLINLYPQMHKLSYLVKLKDCLLLHSEHAPTLFSLISGIHRTHVLLRTLFGLKLPTRDSSSESYFCSSVTCYPQKAKHTLKALETFLQSLSLLMSHIKVRFRD